MLPRFLSAALVMFVLGCSNSNDRPVPRTGQDKPKQDKVIPVGKSFMEHPSGKFVSAIEAMADAIERLRASPESKDWITFTAQGMGGRADSYHFAEIRVRQDELKLQKPVEIDVDLVTKRSGVPRSCFAQNGDAYSMAKATPTQAAHIIDVIFRHYLGIRPHVGEGDDYAVGAEWLDR
jgi:hypothetical protein